MGMKRHNYLHKGVDEEKVICKRAGEVGYCNALAVNGLCKCCDTLCENAVAVIATKDGITKYIALE